MANKGDKPQQQQQPQPEQEPTALENQQSGPVEQKKGSKLFGKVILGIGIVCALITLIIIFFILFIVIGGNSTPLKGPLRGPSTKEPLVSDSEIPAAAGPGLKLPVEQQLAESGVEQLLKDVHAGKIEANMDTGEISFFKKDYHFTIGEGEYNWADLLVIVYPYIPGKKIIEGYENSPKWERSFDKEVELFSSLKPDRQVSIVYDTVVSPETAEIDFRKIGDRYFAVYDASFSPSSSFTRHYFNYDKATRQLIYVYAIFYDFYAVKSSLVKTADGQQAYHKDVVYPENFQGFLDELEKLL